MSCEKNLNKAGQACAKNGISALASKEAAVSSDLRPQKSKNGKQAENGASPFPDPIPQARVADIRWEQRKPITGSSSGVIFRVAPGVVAKVGFVLPSEMKVQRYFAQRGLALPVLDYQEELKVPDAVSRKTCAVHGMRKRPKEDRTCTCGKPQDVLLMPEANKIGRGGQKKVRAFMLEFTQTVATELKQIWDGQRDHIGRYQGRLVAMDFGGIFIRESDPRFQDGSEPKEEDRVFKI